MDTKLLENLSERQRRYLEVRIHEKNDSTAARAIGITPRAVVRWKAEDERFALAYDAAMVQQGAMNDAITVQARVTATQYQLKSYSSRLPGVFKRLFNVALTSVNEPSVLKAIALIGEWYGIGPEQLKTENLTIIQKQILAWTNVKVGPSSSEKVVEQ